MSPLTLLFNILPVVPTNAIRNKMYTHWEERSKTVSVHRCHDHLHRKAKSITKILLELISNYSKVLGYKVNIQKTFAFLYTCNEKVKLEIKNIKPLILAPPKNEILWYKSLKICTRSIREKLRDSNE